jgi:hypothetical protein
VSEGINDITNNLRGQLISSCKIFQVYSEETDEKHRGAKFLPNVENGLHNEALSYPEVTES